MGTWKLSDTAGQDGPTVSVDGTFGVRYTYLDFKRVRGTSSHKDWFDPLIGVRAFFGLSERWSLSMHGNVGGFGVGSDFTWGAMGTIGYRFRVLQ